MKRTSSSKNIPPSSNLSHVFTVSPTQAFFESVARKVIDETKSDPLSLSRYTFLVPHRAAGALLRQAFMAQGPKGAMFLPVIAVPDEVDGEGLSLRLSDNAVLSQTAMDMPPPVSRVERQVFLAQEILKIPGMASSLEKAIQLGGSLGTFLDEAQRYDVDLTSVSHFVPEPFRASWEKTADFLKILTETWPQKLQDMGRVDPEDHRNAALRIQAEYWRQNGGADPVFAVGFSETTPALSALLHAIAQMKNGAVVLPAPDRGLDNGTWADLYPTHPQQPLKEILMALGVAPADIQEWDVSASHKPKPGETGRLDLVRAAWRLDQQHPVDTSALSGLDLVTCGTQQEEASVVALKIREALEDQDKKILLVTPDRSLSRRVRARLRQWGIESSDDSGEALSESPVGIFLLQLADMAAEFLAPVPFLEALKNPLASGGEASNIFQRKVLDIEDMALHGPRPAAGIMGLKESLTASFNRAARVKKPITEERKKELNDFLDRLSSVGKEFFDLLLSSPSSSFSAVLDAHIRFAEALAATDAQTGAARLWQNEDGVGAARFLKGLRRLAKNLPPIHGKSYVGVLRSLMAETKVNLSGKRHPRITITTPDRAMFARGDVVILAGLNDDSWPAPPAENPWLPAEAAALAGFPPPSRMQAHAAHVFSQILMNRDVLLTRSLRSGGSPTVASPFLARLMTVLRRNGLEEAIENKTPILDINKALHRPSRVTPVDPPAPTPEVRDRPRELSVTGVSTLMRDPYSVYARYILKLRPRAPLDAGPTAAERGDFIHAALDAFMRKYPDAIPPTAESDLLKIGGDIFKDRINNPTVRAFWWPRFERIAKWFVHFEKERRQASKTLGTEVRGKLQIDTGDGVFTLTCIADRIDRSADGRLAVIDYKTGSVPQPKEVALGMAPQLTLEALVAISGGFSQIPATDVGSLQYWKLSGGRPAAKIKLVGGDVAKLVAEARDGLTRLAAAFNKKETPYLVTPHPSFAPRYNNARHLSRVDEWSTVKKVAAPAKKQRRAGGSSIAKKRSGKKP